MRVTATPLPGVLLLEPRRFRDARGWFMEGYHRERYTGSGIPGPFVQDNYSWSEPGVLRGLHYQWPQPQAKLVQVLAGAVWDVAVDIRRGSPTFGRWHGELLSAENAHQLYIPEGFAHGFCVVEGPALVAYKCSALYLPEADAGIRWDDPDLGIPWPLEGPPRLSDKDARAPRLAEVPPERLPPWAGEGS